MKKWLTLLVIVLAALVVTAVAWGATDSLGQTLFSQTATTDPQDGSPMGTAAVNIGTVGSDGLSDTGTATATDWANEDSGSESDASVSFSGTCGVGFVCPEGVTSGASPAGNRSAVMKGNVVSPDEEDLETCQVAAALEHSTNPITGHWAAVFGLTGVTCEGFDYVTIETTSCLLRGAEPVPFTYSIVHCGSKSTIGDLEQKITHTCKASSYAYVWKNTAAYDIIDETQGKQRTGHDSSAWKLGNHCH